MTGQLTRAQMRQAGIDSGIPADVVDKMLDRGLVLIDEPYRRLTLRLVIDDEDDPNPLPEGVDPLRPTEPSFTCPRCRTTSWNPNDVREGYCGACHDWTGQPASVGGSDY